MFTEKKLNKSKKPLVRSRFFDVELRGIEPLYPSTNHEFLTRGGPLNSTKTTYHNTYKKKDRTLARTFGDSIESAIVPLSLANP